MSNDNLRQALWSTLSNLERIGDIAREVSDHNYLDSTTIDLCNDIDMEIRFIFTEIIKEEAPTFWREYIEAAGQAKAEEMHP